MKLIRFGEIGKEKTGVVINETMYDTSSLGEDYNELFFETGGLKRLEKFVKENQNNLSKVQGWNKIGKPDRKTVKNCLYWFELRRSCKGN